MAQNINDNLRLHAPKLLDDRAGPYASVAAALAGIPAYQRVEGLEVIIEVGGVQKKYWFDGGIADVDLVEIPSGGSGGYEPKNSIEVDAGELQLVGDEASPGILNYYGTNNLGAKGYHPLPERDEYEQLTPNVDNEILWDCNTGLKKAATVDYAVFNTKLIISNLYNGAQGFFRLNLDIGELETTSIVPQSGANILIRVGDSLTDLGPGIYRIYFNFADTLDIHVMKYEAYIDPTPPEGFQSTWNTENTSTGSSASNQIKLPLISTGVYDFVVDWGDDTSDHITSWNQAETTHTYTVSGEKTIKITGQIEGLQFNGGGDRNKLLNVSNWGGLKLTTHSCFYLCTNFSFNATDSPILATTSFYRMFRGCASFNGDVSDWNTTGVVSMAETFYGCTIFNQDISGWDTSIVTTFHQMFYGAPRFNQNIGAWDVSAVTIYTNMFYGATDFNNGGSSDIGGWIIKNDANISMNWMFFSAQSFNQNIGAWDVSAVTNMQRMFGNADSFNQDISGWNVSAVTDMSNMFNNNQAFNQNIGAWTPSACVNMAGMFQFGVLSYANYDAILIGWTGWTSGAATKSLENSVAFHAGTAKYSTGDAADARAWLVDTILNGGKAWTITDGGPV